MDLIEYLTSHKDRTSPDGERLRDFGKKAAAAYLSEQRPLNDTIATFAKEASLNYEQVRRVCEFANNETFVGVFKTSYDKNVTFPLADASAVAQQAGATKPVEKTAAWLRPERERYVRGQEAVSLEAAFGQREVEKVASGPNRAEAQRLFHEINGHRKHLENEMELDALGFQLLLGRIKTAAWNAKASGEPDWAVSAAIDRAGPSQPVRRMLERTIGDAAAPGGLVKMAEMGYEMAPEDEMTGLVQDLQRVSEKLVASQDLVQNAQAAIQQLLQFLTTEGGSSPTADLFQPDPMRTAQSLQQAGAPAQPPGPQPMPGQAAPGQFPGQTPYGG
ncbi:MAG: hypothetical protein ACOYOB_19185 [Myxococcota bacterium]